MGNPCGRQITMVWWLCFFDCVPTAVVKVVELFTAAVADRDTGAIM